MIELNKKALRDVAEMANRCRLKRMSIDPFAALALLDEVEAAGRRNEELTDALKQTVSGYKSCLRTGHERILDLGGDCDAPEVMIAGNSEIQHAEKLIAAGIGVKGE